MNAKNYNYQDADYFNAEDSFEFRVPTTGDRNNPNYRYFKSKVHFEKGNWWTNEDLNFKATTLECLKVFTE